MIMDMLSDRRAFLKWVSALPTLTAFAAEDAVAKAQKALGYTAKDNIYTRIGVTPIINCRGTWTYTSASLELPEVKSAKQEAAMHFVDMWELQRGVGKRLAELSGAESGMVTAGAAAALATGTAACIPSQAQVIVRAGAIANLHSPRSQVLKGILKNC